jgi:hypothetical protein
MLFPRLNDLWLGEANLFRGLVSGILVTLLLIGMLTLGFNVKPANANETIYIRADDSIDPLTAPIQQEIGTLSEGPPTQWNKTYGGAGVDWAYSVVQTSDGGYAIAGDATGVGPQTDSLLVKTDSAGNMQWSKTYGGAGIDDAASVVQTSDGGYAIAGSTSSFGAGGYDFWLVKTVANGNMLWSKTYGGTNEELAHSVVQANDGGYAIAGETDSYGAGGKDFLLVKVDSAGNMEWRNTYGGGSTDWGESVVQTSDMGYAIAGRTDSYAAGISDFWLIKVAKERYDVTINAYDKVFGAEPFVQIIMDGLPATMTPCTFTSLIGTHTFTVPSTDRLDHLFERWSTGSISTTITVNTDGTYTAYYSVKCDLTITTTSGGTTNPAPDTYTYWFGNVVSVTAIPYSGYLLDHWELNGINVGSTNPISVTMNLNHVLHAVFLPSYDITIKAHCNTEGVDIGVNITMDGNPTGYTTPHTFTSLTGTHTFTVPSTDSSSHPFKQWSTGSTSTTITINSGGTYIAYYQAKYNLIITTASGGNTNPTPSTYTYWSGTVINVVALPNTGSYFDHWELDSVDIRFGSPITITMNTNHTLRAVFSLLNPGHDVAIKAVTPSKTIIGEGYNLTIKVIAMNVGSLTETFNVTVYVNTAIIKLIEVTLQSCAFTALTITWNTTGFAKGNYTVWAYAWPVLGETHTEDNTCTFGTIQITKKGDVNGDDEVNVLDLILVSINLGYMADEKYTIGSKEWYQCMNTDLNDDNEHNVLDLIIVANYLGT